MDVGIALRSIALVIAYAIVVIFAAMQMRLNPASRGTGMVIFLASVALLSWGASLVVAQPGLAAVFHSVSNLLVIVTGLVFGCLLFLWGIDNQLRP